MMHPVAPTHKEQCSPTRDTARGEGYSFYVPTVGRGKKE